jgi:hypothetical protein
LPKDTRLFVGHDYGTDGRDPALEATVADHKARNIHFKDGTAKSDFIKTRDGRLPPAEPDGHSYFKILANKF